MVFNFTNPAGVVSQTLRDMGYDFTYGICDAPSGMLRRFEELYGYPENHLEALCYGLNHLSFFKSIKADGVDITLTNPVVDVGGIAYVPVTFLFDTLGYEVKNLGNGIYAFGTEIDEAAALRAAELI